MGDHDFCLSRSHYTDTDPTSRELAATAGIELGTSSQRAVFSTVACPSERERERERERESLSPNFIVTIFIIVSNASNPKRQK